MFIPNMYVVYEPHPEPLTTKMKFHMAYKDLTSPVFFARRSGLGCRPASQQHSSLWPGCRRLWQAVGGWVRGCHDGKPIWERYSAVASPSGSSLFLPGHRHKLVSGAPCHVRPTICKGDNGKSQPNYSTWGGALISSAISTAYYPGANRGAGHVFSTFGVGMALHVGSSLAQEFIFDRFTSRGKH